MLNIKPLEFDGVFKITSLPYKDSRGDFLRLFSKDMFLKNELNCDWLQSNLSVSKKGVVRGLHFQNKPWSEDKFIRSLQGSIFDVFCDLRPNSKTFKKTGYLILDNPNVGVYVPKGFAHGFQALEHETMVLYLTTQLYNRKFESGIIFNDPELGIDWPIEVSAVSDKDLKLSKLSQVVN